VFCVLNFLFGALVLSIPLLNQRIAGAQFQTPAEVVRWMGAMQAQDYHQALWAIGLRMQAATVAQVEQAIAEGQILRTWPMRGTIHFVPPDDAQWMLTLCASRMLAADARRMRQLDLTLEIIKRCQAVFGDALSGGKRLTRAEMLTLLENDGISTAGQRGYHILWYLAQSGVICLGPMDDKQQTFVLLDEWAPHARDLPREEALAELTRRFFTSHGPATLADFARWSGLTLTDTKAGVRMNSDALIATDIDGTDYWLSREQTAQALDAAAGVYLLPGFDEYVLGYKDRSAVLAAEHAQKIVPGNNGIFFPTVVIDGQIVGVWKRTLKRKGVDLAFEPVTTFGEQEVQVVAAAHEYSDFLELPLASTATSSSH
jgi:hypothetical protein